MGRLPTRRKMFWSILIGAVILVLIFLSLITGKLVEWLWMEQLGYGTIFWGLLFIKLEWFGMAFGLVFLYFWVNLQVVLKTGLRELGRQDVLVVQNAGEITYRGGNYLALMLSCIPALIFGLIYSSEWNTYLRFRWGGPYGLSDPIFGADVGFYLFRLPLYELIQNGLTGLTFITFLLISLAYGSLGALQIGANAPPKARLESDKAFGYSFPFFHWKPGVGLLSRPF